LKQPEKSLILRKPTFTEPHGGGVRFKTGSIEYKTILEWIDNGCQYDSGGPDLKEVSVYPTERILVGEGAKYRLIVTGRYSDGTESDLTQHVRYTSNDETLATVDDGGEVTAKRIGETSIMIRSQGKTAVGTIATIGQLPGANHPETAANNFIDKFVSPSSSGRISFPRAISGSGASAPDVPRHSGNSAQHGGNAPVPSSTDPDKRARLVDELLGRPEFVDLWSLKFADLFQLGGAGSRAVGSCIAGSGSRWPIMSPTTRWCGRC
jgi:hypothetical protein